MEPSAIINALQTVNGSGAAATGLSVQGQQFQAMLNRPPATSTPAGDQHYRYVDEVRTPDQGSTRGVTLSPELVSIGQGISDKLRPVNAKLEVGESTVSMPYFKEKHEQIQELLAFQRSAVQMHVAMKGIELSQQSVSQLFKMQG